MSVTIVDESVHLTRLNIYAKSNSKPITIYIRAYPGDTTIDEMEKYVQQEMNKGVGAYEASLKFLSENDIYYYKMI